MKRDESVYLRHVLDAIIKIEEYIKSIDEVAFNENTLVQDGVIRQLEIIGKAVRHFSSEFRQMHNQLPWQDIAGMRDKLIHDYFGVDLDTVWLTVKEDIPFLKSGVLKILEEYD